jgi:hypothetical protein
MMKSDPEKVKNATSERDCRIDCIGMLKNTLTKDIYIKRVVNADN